MIGRKPRYFFPPPLIDELLVEREPEDPSPTIIVKNEADEIIYRYPSN